jgi:hypothetical protein
MKASNFRRVVGTALPNAPNPSRRPPWQGCGGRDRRLIAGSGELIWLVRQRVIGSITGRRQAGRPPCPAPSADDRRLLAASGRRSLAPHLERRLNDGDRRLPGLDGHQVGRSSGDWHTSTPGQHVAHLRQQGHSSRRGLGGDSAGLTVLAPAEYGPGGGCRESPRDYRT